MGRRARTRPAVADLAVTALGIIGMLGFLMAGRMDDAHASPFDVFAFIWLFVFAALKLSLPWLLRKREMQRRNSA